MEKSKFGVAVSGLKQEGERHDCLFIDPAINETRLYDKRDDAEKFVKDVRENTPEYLRTALALFGIPLKFDVVELVLSRKRVAAQNAGNEFRK
jgi:hypothetical protein